MGQFTACDVGMRLATVPGQSFVAYSNEAGEFRLSYVPPGPYDVAFPSLPRILHGVIVDAGLTTDVGEIPTTDLSSDPDNCGACGNACGSSWICVGGACTAPPACQDGSVQFCYTGPPGTAGVGVCQAGTQTCADGVWGACVGDVLPSAEVCNGLDDNCDGTTDEDAGGLCPGGLACVNGQCIDACPPEQIECGGRCVNLDIDPSNCGTCGNACVVPNGVPMCAAGVCLVSSCDARFEDCNGFAGDGCEVDTRTDVNNCGACGNPCAPGWACMGSVCVSPAACQAGEVQSCYSGPPGSVGVGACQPGLQTCMDGAWSACAGEVLPSPEVCNGLDDDCNGVVDEGVCAPPARPLGAACLTNAECQSGSCVDGVCCEQACAGTCLACSSSKTGLTDGVCAPVPVGMDPDSECVAANAVSACTGGGSCALFACHAGYADCDLFFGNGCETPTMSDTNNCGACGRACEAGQVCVAGACTGQAGAPASAAAGRSPGR